MCTVCGCGSGEVKMGTMVRGRAANAKKTGPTRAWRQIVAHEHAHQHAEDGTHHVYEHEHTPGNGTHEHHAHDHAQVLNQPDQAEQLVGAQAHADAHDHVTQTANHLHFGSGPAHAHVPGLSQSQMIRIEQDILGKNDGLAAQNRRAFAARGIFTLNLVSSPGSGKTTLLVRTIRELAGSVPIAVIEGDQQTEFDAERIRETGAPALQINTGKGCHLDADMVGRALRQLDVADNSLLLIENVGNLVCPAAFDLGEAHKVAILSVTEGEDKPLKYPDMFAAADLMLLNKIDLLPYLSFDVARAIDFARRVNPRLEVIQVSATSGAGMVDWLAWIRRGLASTQIASQGRGA